MDYFVPPRFARNWFESCFLKTLDSALSDASRTFGVRLEDELRVLRGACPASITDADQLGRWVNKHLQKHLSGKMLAHFGCNYDVEQTLLGKLSRWRLSGALHLQARRAQRVLILLGAKAAPRISFHYWRIIRNGSCTGRRFQEAHSRCVFGCENEDSVEHYSRCAWHLVSIALA